MLCDFRTEIPIYPIEQSLPRSSTGYHGTIKAEKHGNTGPWTNPRTIRVAIRP